MSFSIFFPFSISWFQNLWLALCGIYTKKPKIYILDDLIRQKARDDKLWKREFTWATQHGVDKMQCPCAKCEGTGRMVLLRTVRNHLILNGRHPLFRVWKGPGPTDHSDEEWVEASKAVVNPMGTEVGVQVVDEVVNVNQLLDDLFQMPEEEHEGERVANLSLNHNVEGNGGNRHGAECHQDHGRVSIIA